LESEAWITQDDLKDAVTTQTSENNPYKNAPIVKVIHSHAKVINNPNLDRVPRVFGGNLSLKEESQLIRKHIRENLDESNITYDDIMFVSRKIFNHEHLTNNDTKKKSTDIEQEQDHLNLLEQPPKVIMSSNEETLIRGSIHNHSLSSSTNVAEAIPFPTKTVQKAVEFLKTHNAKCKSVHHIGLAKKN